MSRFLMIFRSGMVVVYMAMAGVILFTPVFDYLFPSRAMKWILALLLLGYSAFRLWRVFVPKDPSRKDTSLTEDETT